jgi:hypothetical protein
MTKDSTTGERAELVAEIKAINMASFPGSLGDHDMAAERIANLIELSGPSRMAASSKGDMPGTASI